MFIPQPQPPELHPGEDGGTPPLEDASDEPPLANTEKSFSIDFPPHSGHTALSLLFCNISKLLSHFLHLYSYKGIIFLLVVFEKVN